MHKWSDSFLETCLEIWGSRRVFVVYAGAENTPLVYNKKISVIREVPDGTDCFGWAGELLLGWQILSTVYDSANDGLVPYDSAVINGAEHIADFPHYDHYDLVSQPDVAKTAAEHLP